MVEMWGARLVGGLVDALHNDEGREEQGNANAIVHPLLAIHYQGSQQIVVDKEYNKKDAVLPPDVPDLMPGKV